MGQISVERNIDRIEGLCVITPAVHGDSRGYFMETYSARDMAEAGLDMITLEMDQSSAQLQLDLAHEAGIRILAVLAPYTDHKSLDDVDMAMNKYNPKKQKKKKAVEAVAETQEGGTENAAE